MKKKKIGPYSVGEVNRAIDVATRPFIRRHGAPAIVVDSVLHAIVERDPPASFIKFLKYNLSPLIRDVVEKKIVKS